MNYGISNKINTWFRFAVLCCDYIMVLNSLWPSEAIWWQRSGSTLAQVMACCLTAPSHYPNQCWLIRMIIISKVPWKISEGIIITRSEDTSQQNKISSCIFKIASRSPRDQWVNRFWFVWLMNHSFFMAASLTLGRLLNEVILKDMGKISQQPQQNPVCTT